jgi:hypothetical protein
MNLIDALKKGRCIRRANGVWHIPTSTRGYFTEDVLADDWEAEEDELTITETQFKKAFSSMLAPDFRYIELWNRMKAEVESHE